MTNAFADRSKFAYLAQDDEIPQHLLAFNDREGYLAWLKDWKAALSDVICDIHAEKAIRRDKSNTTKQRDDANCQRQWLRGVARGLNLIRVESKRLAARQREQARKIVTAA